MVRMLSGFFTLWKMSFLPLSGGVQAVQRLQIL
jgi:hypothetical protein